MKYRYCCTPVSVHHCKKASDFYIYVPHRGDPPQNANDDQNKQISAPWKPTAHANRTYLWKTTCSTKEAFTVATNNTCLTNRPYVLPTYQPVVMHPLPQTLFQAS